MRKTSMLVGALLVALLVVVAGCGNDDDEQQGSGSSAQESGGADGGAESGGAEIQPPQAIADKGKIIFCTDPTFPNAEFMEGSEFKGFDIDVGDEIARRMGVEAEWTVVGFDALIPAVDSARCDAIISALRRTPEREEQIDFVTYMEVGVGLLVASGNPEGIETFDDVSGKSVSVLVGSFNKDALDALNEELQTAGKEPAKIVLFPKDSDAATAVRTNRVDAYFSGMTSVAFYVEEAPDAFEVVQESNIDPGPWGIGIQKDDQELEQALQAAVDAMYEDGTMLEILERWGVEKTALTGAPE